MGSAERYYIVLPKKNTDIKYSEKMLLNSRLEHLLQMSVRHMDGTDSYYYDVGSRISLSEFVEEKNLDRREIAVLFTGISNMLSELSEYLLKTGGLLLCPDYIMMNSDSPEFCYYPDAEEEGGDFKGLAEYLLQVTDYEDEVAVKMVYDYYELVCDGIIDPKSVVVMPDDEDEAGKEAELAEAENGEYIDDKEDEESFYFREQEDEEEKLNVNNAIKPLAIACAVILILGGIYTFLFMNPDILAGLGMEKSDYIVVAAVLCGVLSMLVAIMLHKLLIKRT